MKKDQIKKVEDQIRDCEDELKVISFERDVGLRVARKRKILELDTREIEIRTQISQLSQLIEELKKLEGEKDETIGE